MVPFSAPPPTTDQSSAPLDHATFVVSFNPSVCVVFRQKRRQLVLRFCRVGTETQLNDAMRQFATDATSSVAGKSNV